MENLTPEHRKTLNWTADRMKLDRVQKIIRCEYPFNGKENLQVSNYGQALTVQKAVERKLAKDGLIEEYVTEMQRAIEVGAVV